MEVEQALEDIHRTIILKLATALSAVRLLSAAAPFCDPALSIVTDDLEQALDASRQARLVTDELRRLVVERPYRSSEQPGVQ